MSVDLFDAAASRAERDSELLRVSVNAGSFADRAHAVICKMPDGDYTGEDIRRKCVESDVVPHHHNAWGAVIMRAVRTGLLRPTGEYVGMKSVRSHARKTAVYRKWCA